MKIYLKLTLGSLILGTLFFNCSRVALEGNKEQSSNLPSGITNTSTSDFDININNTSTNSTLNTELCHRWVDGNDSNGVPTWAPLKGQCEAPNDALLFSVTHENSCNTHMACKGYPNDLNYKENIYAYMADYNPLDIGKWIKYSAAGNKTNNQIQMSIDTINYPTINVTGRPVSEGYKYFGFADLGFSGEVNLSDEFLVEFEYKVHISELSSTKTDGNRVMLGAALIWDEPGRSNKVHYFEVNLFKTAGYHDLHFDKNQCTKDVSYDHCYYDSNGKWAEGKYVSTLTALGFPSPTTADNQWRKIQVDFTKLVRSFDWHHKPADWKNARIDGLYMGIENRGKSLLYISLNNFRRTYRKTSVPAPAPTPTPVANLRFNNSSHPVGFFRDQAGGFHSDGHSVCYFSDGDHFINTGYTQENYNQARQVPLREVKLPQIGLCSAKEKYGLVRSDQVGLIKHKSGFCLLSSSEHLQKCGFRQVDYDTAPRVSINNINQLPACSCP